MKDATEETNKEQSGKVEHFVGVAVVTTSGSYPKEGYDRTPANQKVSVILKKAANKLEITDTSGWVATVGSKVINVDASYQDNALTGQVEIDYGPSEGGGGDA